MSEVDAAPAIAYSEAVRALAEQQAAVESARDRVGTVFPIAALGSGFLASTALEEHEGLPWLGWVGTLALVATTVCVVAVIWPRKFTWTNKPDVLAGEEWRDRPMPEVHRLLAIRMAGHLDGNGPKVDATWWWVRGAIVAAMTSIVAWVLLLAGVST